MSLSVESVLGKVGVDGKCGLLKCWHTYFIMHKQGSYCFSHEGKKKKKHHFSVDIVYYGKSYYISNECLNSKGAEGVLWREFWEHQIQKRRFSFVDLQYV